MALAQNRLVMKLRTKVGVRFTRFVGVAAASLATSEILLAVCDGGFHMTSKPTALVATFGGAAVSYVREPLGVGAQGQAGRAARDRPVLGDLGRWSG